MTAYAVANTEVFAIGNRPKVPVIFGEALDPGVALYRKASDGRHYKAQADGTAEEATFAGISLSTAAAAGQPGLMADGGEVQLDTAALLNAAVGDIVVLGAVAGSLYPSGDLVSTNRVSVVGYIKTSNPGVLVIDPMLTGVQKP